jgi:hypothetical protein
MLFAGSLIGGAIAFLTYGPGGDLGAHAAGPPDQRLRGHHHQLPGGGPPISGPMIVWALLIAVLTLSTLLTGFLALVIVFPWLGLATWRAYGELVES